MGIYDRDYVNSGRGVGSGGSGGGDRLIARAPGWTVTTWIIVINVVVHFLAILAMPQLYAIGQLTVFDAFQRLEVWRLITFQFLHNPVSLTHLLFNMFGMWMFGPMVEKYLGGKKYLAYYLVCGLAGGLLFTILTLVGVLSNGVNTPLIGASAGVFGVIVACAHVAPNTVIQLLFPPIPLKMRTFAYGYVGISLISLLMGTQNAGGEAAHIGGAVAGFFFVRNSKLLEDFFDVIGDSREPKQGNGKKRAPKKTSYRNYNNTNPGGPSVEDVDRILKKVSEKGIASLNAKEKRTLSEASKNDD